MSDETRERVGDAAETSGADKDNSVNEGIIVGKYGFISESVFSTAFSAWRAKI